MDVFVRVEMRQRSARRQHSLDLGGQLALDLDERHAPLEARDDERPPRLTKPSIVGHEGGNAVGGQGRYAVDQGQMRSDTE